MKRDIIRIDEEKCTGCGQCIPNCPEGALQVIDGKVRLVSDLACDGLGACIGHCPEDAISIESREAEPYDERKVMETIVEAGPNVARAELRQWPVQLHLLNPHAPHFRGADLLIAADCVPFTCADFHDRFLKGKVLVVFCPKLDDSDDIYIEKMAEIIRHNGIKSITAAHMEVPCCFGTTRLIEEALKRSGKNITVEDYTVSIRGDLV